METQTGSIIMYHILDGLILSSYLFATFMNRLTNIVNGEVPWFMLLASGKYLVYVMQEGVND